MTTTMTMMKFDTEAINSLIERQLEVWPDARHNFGRLREVRRKPVKLGDLEVWVQLNPARIVSTGAKTDAKSIAERPCFLCKENRPQEQYAFEWMPGWELLVNPFPILPVHFTIVSTRHQPQAAIPLEMAAMAEAAPDLAIFFNGARAGASAPDHLHLQAVLKDELPLIRLAEKNHPSSKCGFMASDDFGLDLPFSFISAVITPDQTGSQTLAKIPALCGIDADNGQPDRGLVNAFFWIGTDGILRAAIIPRRRHRPTCYGSGEEDFTVSPGAIDMAGIMITPREQDFERIDAPKMQEIYNDVAFGKD